ncbi:MAG: hypothetical protein OXE57_10585, partial [Alphaproteobacteria bacterium]|nr:hypothetical protein [Alphaproteobacteria bacterium]
HGRDDTALPACMGIPSTGEDRVGLVGAVADPVRTVTGIRWEPEFHTVNCATNAVLAAGLTACPPAVPNGFCEARQVPIQVTALTNCPVATPNCNDLSATAPRAPHLWPRDCALRAGLGSRAACTDWRHAGGLCPFQYAQAAPPTPIPDAVITWRPAPVHRTTGSCSCPAGEQGSCTLNYEQGTEYRDFRVRPGAPVVTTRRIARGDAGRRRLVGRIENCTPIETGCEGDCGNGPDGENGGEGDDDGDSSTSTSTGGDHPGLDDNTGVSFGTGTDAETEAESSANGDSGGGGDKPIILDLDGDGVELVPLEESTAFFDINGDGYRERMAWAAADDGFLTYDKDSDGRIAEHDELSFVSYVEGARTDLEGLRHFDSDGDGLLDPDDADWAMFRVWQDLDQDGESDPGELSSLDEAGIESISLTSDGIRRTVAGNTVFGEGEYVGPHGPRAFWDAALRRGERKE